MPLEGYRKEKVIISTSAGVKWRKEGIRNSNEDIIKLNFW